MKNIHLISLAILLLFASCKKEEKQTQLTISFEHVVGNESLVFDTIHYTNTFGNNYSVATLKYFVSGFTLTKDDGKKYIYEDIHYVDGREPGTHSFMPAMKVPAGAYTNLTFIFGLDTETNKTGLFTNPPESLMEWPLAMGGGYHYMKLEGKVDSTGTINNFQAHTGPTMGNSNYLELSADITGFSCDCETVNIAIVMDINKWWDTPNILDLNQVTMIMGNQPMQEKLKSNGNDVFSIKLLK